MANGAQPADNEEVAPKTLTQRMAAIRKDASGIGKEAIKMQSKSGSEFTIAAHTIEGVLHGIRTLLDKHGVWMEPQLVSREFSGNRCDVMMDFHFESVDDSGDTKVVRWAGSGTDNSDKGFAKAGTNALKEMLKKVFLITDREDAKEEEDRTEYQSADAGNNAAMERQKETARKAIEQWAKAFKVALENAKTIEDVQRLQRENKDSLASEHTPDVTRTFFIELIESRKKELSK